MVFALQPDGTVTARGAGEQTAPSTDGEQKGQRRMKTGNPYVQSVLSDPALKAIYAREAQARMMRTCDLVMSDFLADPVIASVDAAKYSGRAEGWLLIMTGDDFKVVRVGVVLRDAAGQRLEEGFAVAAQGGAAKVWIYTAQKDLAAGQVLTVEVTAIDRPGHSTVLTTAHPV